MAVTMDIERYDAKHTSAGTKRSFSLMVDVGLPEKMTMPVLHIDGAAAGATLLILASVHGDEYEGVETALRLYRDVNPDELAGTILIVPTANPLAYRGATRTSPEDGVNMARAFPGKPDGTPTERIAWQLHHRFIAAADFMLDLHSGGTHYSISTLVGYYDNEATDVGRRSRAAAESFGAELLWAHAAINPGRSVSSAIALGVPCLYTEAYGGKRVRREDAELFYRGAFRLMAHLGMLSGASADAWAAEAEAACAQTAAQARRIYGDGNFDESELAAADGFFIPALPLGAEAKAGETVGSIYGLDGEEAQRIVAASSGVVVMLPGTPIVRAGEALFMIASLEP
ncbi:MAG: succinylglutamate desuccinylase [Paenibacillus sp.]|nr:succinylglutamate desuccinylase [Paenibacillus sp.]